MEFPTLPEQVTSRLKPIHQGDASAVEKKTKPNLGMCRYYKKVIRSERTSSGPIGQVWGDSVGLFIWAQSALLKGVRNL